MANTYPDHRWFSTFEQTSSSSLMLLIMLMLACDRSVVNLLSIARSWWSATPGKVGGISLNSFSSLSRFTILPCWVTGIAYRRGYYGFPNHSAICSPHILTSQAHICNVTMRFSCAGSRPVGLPAEYQSLFTAGVAPRLGEYAGAITSITACWIATARHLLPGANTQSPQAE